MPILISRIAAGKRGRAEPRNTRQERPEFSAGSRISKRMPPAVCRPSGTVRKSLRPWSSQPPSPSLSTSSANPRLAYGARSTGDRARFDRGIFAVLRFDERPRLRPQYRSRRCVCNQVAEVDRSRTVAVPAEDRIQLRQHNPAFSAGSFDDRVGDQVGFIQARSPDGDGIYGMRREGAADHITVIRVVPGIEFIPRKPPGTPDGRGRPDQ